MARSVVESILAGKESGLRAGERVQRQFERMALAQQEAERYREQREMEGAERVFNFGRSQLEDVAWNIRTPDEQKAPVIGTTQAAAKRMGIEWAFVDPVPQAMLADFHKIGIDPAKRFWPSEQAYDYLEGIYGRYFHSALNELIDQAKLTGMEEEGRKAEEAYQAEVKKVREEALAKGKGPTAEGAEAISAVPRPAPPKSRKQMIAESLFGDTRDPFSAEDMARIDRGAGSELARAAALQDPSFRPALSKYAVSIGLAPDDLNGVFDYRYREMEKERIRKNSLSAEDGWAAGEKMIRAGTDPVTAAESTWQTVRNNPDWTGTEEAYKAPLLAMSGITEYQQASLRLRAEGYLLAAKALGLKTSIDILKWLSSLGIGPENPVFGQAELMLGGGMTISPAPVVEITEAGTSGLPVLPLPEPGMFGPETFPRLGNVPGQTVTQQNQEELARARLGISQAHLRLSQASEARISGKTPTEQDLSKRKQSLLKDAANLRRAQAAEYDPTVQADIGDLLKGMQNEIGWIDQELAKLRAGRKAPPKKGADLSQGARNHLRRELQPLIDKIGGLPTKAELKEWLSQRGFGYDPEAAWRAVQGMRTRKLKEKVFRKTT